MLRETVVRLPPSLAQVRIYVTDNWADAYGGALQSSVSALQRDGTFGRSGSNLSRASGGAGGGAFGGGRGSGASVGGVLLTPREGEAAADVTAPPAGEASTFVDASAAAS